MRSSVPLRKSIDWSAMVVPLGVRGIYLYVLGERKSVWGPTSARSSKNPKARRAPRYIFWAEPTASAQRPSWSRHDDQSHLAWLDHARERRRLRGAAPRR